MKWPPAESTESGWIQTILRVREAQVLGHMIELGRRLGVFDHFAGNQCHSAQSLATLCNVHVRWLEEWLYAMGASGFLNVDAGKWNASPELITVLTDQLSASYVGELFSDPRSDADLASLTDSFRCGIGRSWAAHGHTTCGMQTSMTAPRQAAGLVEALFPTVHGLVDRLRGGAVLYDVGCGAGFAAALIGKAFPDSQVVGLDPSSVAIAKAMSQPALPNVTYKVGGFEELDQMDSPDIILTIDVLHDLPKVQPAATSTYRSLKDGGLWLIQDMRCWPTFQENVANIEWAALYYGMSLMYCLGSSLSTADSEGYGAMGLHPARVVQILDDANFTSIRSFVEQSYGNSQWYVARKKEDSGE